jgi:hypothetical protein
MRRILLIALTAVLAASACQIPGVSESLGTAGAHIKTGEVIITQLPQALTELPKTVEMQTETPSGKYAGYIRGHLSYPGSLLPAQRIVAFYVPVFQDEPLTPASMVTTIDGQYEYEMTILDVDNDFYVVAYTLDGKFSAGYTQAVPCGLLASCTNHNLIPVHVGSGAVVENIDPADWYAPPGTFPPMP